MFDLGWFLSDSTTALFSLAIQERKVFVLRALFTEGIKFESDEESEQAEIFRSLILPDIEKQSAFVRGKDKEGLAIMTIKARTEIASEDEAFIYTQL